MALKTLRFRALLRGNEGGVLRACGLLMACCRHLTPKRDTRFKQEVKNDRVSNGSRVSGAGVPHVAKS